MRFAVDSNVLVYAIDSTDKRKHDLAARIMKSAPVLDCVVPTQVLAEFLNVIRRKQRSYFEQAGIQAERWNDILTILPTTSEDVLEGAKLSKRYDLQLWDSIICRVAHAARAALFLTEDLQDGLSFEGMRVINPFEPANGLELHKLLTSANDEVEW